MLTNKPQHLCIRSLCVEILLSHLIRDQDIIALRLSTSAALCIGSFESKCLPGLDSSIPGPQIPGWYATDLNASGPTAIMWNTFTLLQVCILSFDLDVNGRTVAGGAWFLHLLQSELQFWGPKHAGKLMKLCTHARSGGNLHLIWVSEVGVAKWLNRATYNISTKCPSSYVLHTCNIPIPTKKKSETQHLEFSRQVLCRFCHFQALYSQSPPPGDLSRSLSNLVSVI